VVLVRPYDATFMSYESLVSSRDVMAWLRGRLLEHIDLVTSLGQLQRHWLRSTHQLSVIVCLDDTAVMPLFLPVLAVLHDGRVRFARVSRSVASRAVTLPSERLTVMLVSGADVTYMYGVGDADCMTLPGVRLLLTVLAPSSVDLLDLTVTVSLLLLCLEPCLVFSSLKCRLVSLLLLSLRLSFLLLLYCFFVSYVMPEHELCQLLDGLLHVWRYMMLTSFGDQLRADWLRYTTVNFDFFVWSYLVYVLVVAWCYRRLCRQKVAWLSYWNSLQDDDDDERELIDWYTWQRFGVGASSGETSDRCVVCHQSVSHGCSVCRLACQHVFHLSCLSSLIHSHESVCPACHAQFTLPASDDRYLS